MRKVLVIQSGAMKFCVDTRDIESVHGNNRSTDMLLAELKKSGERPDLKIYSLSNLTGRRADPSEDGKQLILLKSGASGIGLLVDRIGATETLAEDSVHPLPHALPRNCFDCFPEIAVMEKLAAPLLKVETILALAGQGSEKKGNN